MVWGLGHNGRGDLGRGMAPQKQGTIVGEGERRNLHASGDKKPLAQAREGRALLLWAIGGQAPLVWATGSRGLSVMWYLLCDLQVAGMDGSVVSKA